MLIKKRTNMKLLFIALFTMTALFANNTFKKNIQYTCINTHTIQEGQTFQANEKEAKNKPFIFTINEQGIQTKENVHFNFMMSNGPMSSYSNTQYMLLLTPDLVVGLVPKKSRGSLQFYFKCQE